MNPLALAHSIRHKLEPRLSHWLRPQRLGAIATRMPGPINRQLVERLLNNAFAEQIREGDFESLQGRILEVAIQDAGVHVGIGYQTGRLRCEHFDRTPCAADASLTINSLDAIGLVQQQVDPDTLFFQRKLRISGDTNLAHHVKNTIDTLDPSVIPRPLMRLIEQYRLRVLLAQSEPLSDRI